LIIFSVYRSPNENETEMYLIIQNIRLNAARAVGNIFYVAIQEQYNPNLYENTENLKGVFQFHLHIFA